MADFRLRLIVDPFQAQKAFQQVEGAMERVEKRANRLREGLGTVLRSTGVVFLTQQLANLGDEYTTLQNRIRFVTKSQAELAEITSRLTGIANSTRLALSSVGTLFTRLAVNSRDLGLSFEEILGFTKSLNQAIVLSGATVKEANAALVQLSQGLASGALRGDELRSVLEQLPFVADIIGRRLKVTRGELRGLGQDGALTSSVIVAAFKDVAGELEELFKRTVPTLSQSFEVLRNKVVEFVGAGDQANGVTAKLSQAILVVANNIETLARIITTVLVAKALGALVASLARIRVLLLTNPFALLASGAALAVGAIVGFGDKIDIFGDQISHLQDLIVSAFDNVVAAFKNGNFELALVVAAASAAAISFAALVAPVSRVGGTMRALTAVISSNPLLLFTLSALAAGVAVSKLSAELDELQRKAEQGTELNTQVEVLEFIRVRLEKENAELRRLEATLSARTASGIDENSEASRVLAAEIRGVRAEVLSLSKAREQALQELNKLNDEFDAEDAGRKIGDDIAAGIESSGLTGLFQSIFEDADERARQREQDALKIAQLRPDLTQSGQAADPAALSDRLRDLTREADLLLLVGRSTEELILARKAEQEVGGELSKQQKERLRDQVLYNEDLRQQAQLYREIVGPIEAVVSGYRNLKANLDLGIISQEQYNVKLRSLNIAALEAEKTVGGNLAAAILRLQEELTAANIATDIFSSGVNTAADALTEFITKGKADIKAFASAFLADVTRIIAKLLILQAIEAGISAFGGGGAGVVTNLAAGARAGGGPVAANRAYLVGEEGPEFIIPRASGVVIPADRSAALLAGSEGPRGTGSTPAPNVNVSVVNSLDPSVALAALDSPRGHKVVLNAIVAQKRQVQSVLS